MPKITVILPVFNGEKYIKNSIESVLNQRFNDFELIIVNDGSTDSTLNIIQGFNDSHIKLINQTNQGLVKPEIMHYMNLKEIIYYF